MSREKLKAIPRSINLRRVSMTSKRSVVFAGPVRTAAERAALKTDEIGTAVCN